MKPSEKIRNFALKVSSSKFHSISWAILGIIMAIIGVIILCIFGL